MLFIDNIMNKNINSDSSTEKVTPINHGTKWSSDDRKILFKALKRNTSLLDDFNNIIITQLAKKLGRTEGGIKAEIKKNIIERYFKGVEIEVISVEMNIMIYLIKSTIKMYIERDCDAEIHNLEKENKLLTLKINNMMLKKQIKEQYEES